MVSASLIEGRRFDENKAPNLVVYSGERPAVSNALHPVATEDQCLDFPAPSRPGSADTVPAHDDDTATPLPAPSHWAASCTHQECTLHQLSPYIGKLKSVIARDLVLQYSRPGQLVADMFCGSGTVPLEAAQLGRRVFASDASAYAITLTKGKLYAPIDSSIALSEADAFLKHAESRPTPDLRRVPKWVRAFFHPRTLKEAIRLSELLREEKRHFLLSSLLGILHHQRPGFLSFPSSHLVPYLRSNKFDRETRPELYQYRPLSPRLKAKVERMLKRAPARGLDDAVEGIRQSPVESIDLPDSIDCVITSPHYMNALDYGRDNRLRLWFLKERHTASMDRATGDLQGFTKAMKALVRQLSRKVRPGGYCIFVVGDKTSRRDDRYPSRELTRIFEAQAPVFQLRRVVRDVIPDVRRSRRETGGVKQENILVFRKD